MWFIADYMFVEASNYYSPRGFDISHCYLITLNKLTQNSQEYNPNDTSVSDNKAEILSRLQHRPEIEAASYSLSSYPYDGSNSSSTVSHDTLKEGNDNQWIMRRVVSPDFVRVFRFQGANGETPEQLSEILKQGKLLLSDNLFMKYNIPSLHDYVGKVFHLDNDTTQDFILGATLKPVKYNDFWSSRGTFTVVFSLDKSYYDQMNDLCVRVKDNMDKNFIDNLWKDADKQFRVGNMYISDIQSFDNIRNSFQRQQVNDVRLYSVGAVFLMLNIFLGILGTFWFRTQQRTGEIALCKALGSSNKNVFLRSVSEGLILLTFATIIAAVIDFNLAYSHLNTYNDGVTLEASRFIFTVLASYLSVAVMIVLGIWFPAKKAMNIQPAEALHDE
jgi:putative ABC transport system permease protein